MREKLCASVIGSDKAGITPACAGKTRLVIVKQLNNWDHPRVCGKNWLKTRFPTPAMGSPPRVREKRQRWQKELAQHGITPACAGKTSAFHNGQYENQDHPRVCGKNSKRTFQPTASQGSPPRVREKRSNAGYRVNYDRITPACAGKTSLHLELKDSLGDHPRVCGKNLNREMNNEDGTGSPPRVREKQGCSDYD